MSILDKAKEAATAAAEKTRELASSAVDIVEEAGVKARELAHEAGTAVAEGVSTTVEKARELASEAGDAAKGIGSAIANATVVDSAKAFTAEEQKEDAAQASEIAAMGKTTGDGNKG
jgi:hypothetical protein